VASVAFWGACPRRGACAVGAQELGCPCCTSFALGGITAAQPTTGKGSPSEEPLPKDGLAARMNQLLLGASLATRRSVKHVALAENSGLAFLPGAVSVASTGALTLALAGSIAPEGREDGEEAVVPDARERVAWELLQFYQDAARTCADVDDLVGALRAGLGAMHLKGSYAFVMLDRAAHRVVAARDATGAVDLMWGLAQDGSLQFATTLDSAIDQCRFVPFPKGAVFVSMVEDAYGVFVEGRCPGRLLSFARRTPAKPPKPSAAAMCRIMSGTDLAMITTSSGWMIRTPSMGDLVNAAAMRHSSSAR